jgi:glycosyltransferase involved in cell wall biosynthesis
MASRPVKVLLLVENNAYPRDFRVRREAQTLRQAGFEVSVVAPRDPDEPWSETVDDVSVYRFPPPPGGSGVLSYAAEFGYATVAILIVSLWVWLREGVDVVHAANPPDTLFIVGAVFRVLGKRFVFDQHDLAPETYLSRFGQPRQDAIYKTLRAIERCSYGMANVVITTNESYRQLAVSRGGKRPDDVFVVRNGPPLAYQPVAVEASVANRAKYLIGYVGTIGPQDGVDYLIRAVHHLFFALGRRDFVAIIIGDGDALPSVRALASKLGVDEHVWFTGRLSELEVRRHLSAVHICVQPDPLSPLNDKSTMNKLMEYMALGKPTVAFDLTETRYSAQDAAIYVSPNDVVQFAQQIAWLLDNPSVRDQMGAAGQRRVQQQLAWEYSARELRRAYTEGLHLS